MDSQKKWFHFEMTEGSNYAVECNWNWHFSQNVQKFCLLEKINRVSEIFWTFFDIAKSMNFAVESEWKSKASENVQNLFCFSNKRWVSREKILKYFVKMLKVANLLQNRFNY